MKNLQISLFFFFNSYTYERIYVGMYVCMNKTWNVSACQ